MLTQPKLLPCGHTFCHRCLEKFVNPKLLVECPICRKVASNTSWFWKVFDDLKVRPKETQLSVLGVASLPDNIALRREVSFSLFWHLNCFCRLATGQKTAKLFKLNTFQPSASDGVDTGEGEEGGAGMVVVDNKNKLDKNKAADLNEQLKMSFARLRRYYLWV